MKPITYILKSQSIFRETTSLMDRLSKFSFFILMLVIFGSCKNKDEQIGMPANVLGEEALTTLLVDFALAESASNLNIKNVPLTKTDSVYAFNPLRENAVRKTQYDSTLLFYSAHPQLYKKIYENVIVKLTELQARGVQVKKDSLRAVPKP